MSKTASERSMLQVGRVMRYVSSIVGRQSRFLVLLMMAGLISIAKPVFLTPDNVLNLLRQASLIFVLGAGQTLVILTTGIDLSMSSVAALSGVIMATLLHAGQPVVLSIVVGLAIGAVMGLINGLLITRVGLPPFVATFGMWMVGKGLTVWYIDGEVIWGFPQSFRVLGASRIGPVPSIIIIGLLVFLIFHGILRYTTFGRSVYAIGASTPASWVSGIRVKRILTIVYIISGVMAAFGSMLYISRLNSAKSDIGEGFELDSIAATLIGGTSFSGGVGSVGGTVIGALIMAVLRNALIIFGISPLWQSLVTGTVVIAALAADEFIRRRVMGLS